MNQPLISIVLCTYNGAFFIEEQLQSLFLQTYPNLEIIISDDGSTDETRTILEKYRSKKSVQIFFQHQTLGAINNVAFALQQTRGDFIAFCDQDDVWLPQKVAALHAAIGDNLLVYSDSDLVDEAGKSLHKKLSQLRHMYTGTDTRGFIFSNVAWGHTILVNRKLLSSALPIPVNVPHDIWLAFKAATISGIQYLDLPLTKYRQHRGSVTKTIAEKTGARTISNRYADFVKVLNWIDVMQQNARPAEQAFYKKMHGLYQHKTRGNFQWPLAFFILAHLKALYRFSKKSWLSKVIDALKHARGVTP